MPSPHHVDSELLTTAIKDTIAGSRMRLTKTAAKELALSLLESLQKSAKALETKATREHWLKDKDEWEASFSVKKQDLHGVEFYDFLHKPASDATEQ